jgi:RNA polymerase sigma-70 factor (ECF subfamily)
MLFYTLDQINNRTTELEKLLLRVAEDDKDALGKLYGLIAQDVYAYALSKTLNKADSEDVLHDTFVRIYRYAKRYEPKGRPMAWIITIAKHVIFRLTELKNRHTELNDAIDVSLDTTREIDNAIKNEYVRYLLSTLSEPEREIVVLYAVSGLKHREISEVLKLPLPTVLSRYNRAIKKLRERESDYGA